MGNNIKQYRRTLKDYSVAVIFFMFLDIIDMLQSYTNGEYDIHSLGGDRSALIALKGGYFDVYTTVQSLAAAAVLFLFIRASKKLRKAEKIG